jgi:hypothetical protein
VVCQYAETGQGGQPDGHRQGHGPHGFLERAAR